MEEPIPPDYALSSYRYVLPPEHIAQQPTGERTDSRLLLVDCCADQLADRLFPDLAELLLPGDLLVMNDTRVFPARLLGRKQSGGQVELLMLEYPRLEKALACPAAGKGWQQVEVEGLLRSSRRPAPGSLLFFHDRLQALVKEWGPAGRTRLWLRFRGELPALLESCGRLPLPPYIQRPAGEHPADRQRYQTVYASRPGAVAAPTAGLHFSEELLARIRGKGVGIATVTLHVGYGTFAPVRVEDIRRHRIHAEYLALSPETAGLVNAAREGGGRIWAVGTTTARALEFAADQAGRLRPRQGLCDLYIYPGYRFKVVENLVTNFHLPASSLLFLVSALGGRQRILAAYHHAVRENYRFYSYGDAMVIMTRNGR